MSRNYSVTEPHPSVSKTSYIGGGRGGAGNYKRYNKTEITSGPDATGPPSLASLVSKTSPAKKTYIGGRGGAGNTFHASSEAERTIFQFDEEMVKKREAQAPVYHISRGGAGNFFDDRKHRTDRMDSVSSGSSSDSASTRRSIEGAFSKLGRKFGSRNI